MSDSHRMMIMMCVYVLDSNYHMKMKEDGKESDWGSRGMACQKKTSLLGLSLIPSHV